MQHSRRTFVQKLAALSLDRLHAAAGDDPSAIASTQEQAIAGSPGVS